MTREHAQWDELAVGHAFSALEPEDEEVFLAHLRGCGLCERTLTESHEVAAHLAYAAEPAEPPAELRAAIVDAVRRSGRPAVFPEQVTPLRTPARAAPAARSRFSSNRVSASVVGLAAGLVAVIGLGVWNTNLRANIDVKNAAIARMERVGELEADPSTVRVALTSSALSTGGDAHGTALLRGSQAYVLVQGLPVNAADSTYVLWYRDSQGGYHAVDTFDIAEPDHINIVEATLDRPIERIAGIAVSREPGRSAPTTPSTALVQGVIRA